jgi:ribosomal protein S8
MRHTYAPNYAASFIQIVGQLRHAYRRRLVAVILRSRAAGSVFGAVTCFAKLQQWGLIAHWEPVQFGRHPRYRLYLRYTRRQPAVQIATFYRQSQQTHILTLEVLARLAREQGGLRVILRTTKGLLTSDECLRQRVGGALVLSLYAG